MPTLPPHDRITPAQMIDRLDRALPPAELALLRLVAGEAERLSLPLYIIGGFVRDLFIGHAGLDFDLVVEGDAVALARSFAKRFGGRIVVHPQFGTATWEPDLDSLKQADDVFTTGKFHPLDFITARSEIYAHPGALPTVSAGSLQDDLCRRDFSINTLALRLDGAHFGELYDPLGGLEDIQAARIHVLHDESYVDDPTRILRAVRYEQRYEFHIDPADLGLIAQARSGLGSLSGERLRHELDLVLAEPHSIAMLARLQELNILTEIDPLLPWDDHLAAALQKVAAMEPEACREVPDLPHVPRCVALGWLVWLGGLSQAGVLQLARRLDFTARLRDALLALSALLPGLPSFVDAQPSRVTERLDEVPLPSVCAAWYRAEESVQPKLEAYLSTWRFVMPRTDGDALIRRGLAPGPAFRTILAGLRRAWLDGRIHSEKEEELLLVQLINQI